MPVLGEGVYSYTRIDQASVVSFWNRDGPALSSSPAMSPSTRRRYVNLYISNITPRASHHVISLASRPIVASPWSDRETLTGAVSFKSKNDNRGLFGGFKGINFNSLILATSIRVINGTRSAASARRCVWSGSLMNRCTYGHN